MLKPLPIALVVIALLSLIVGVLYLVGAIQVFTSTGQGHHTTHFILFVVLAIVFLVGANFARQRTA